MNRIRSKALIGELWTFASARHSRWSASSPLLRGSRSFQKCYAGTFTTASYQDKIGKEKILENKGVEDLEPYYQVNFDLKAVTENAKFVAENAKLRNVEVDVPEVVKKYTEYRDTLLDLEMVRAERNSVARAVAVGLYDDEAKEVLKSRGVLLKEQMSQHEFDLEHLRRKLQSLAAKLPNISHPDAPVGDMSHARVVKVYDGEHERVTDYKVPDEVDGESMKGPSGMDIAKKLGLVDFEAGVKVAGRKFAFLKKEAALLEMALSTWALQFLSSKGFEPMTTPDLVKESILWKCGFRPRMENTQTYRIRESELCLTGTAEVPLGGYFSEKTLSTKTLPHRVAGFGHCFRTEAGAAGVIDSGLYRLHQFSKVEMFVLSHPDSSDEELLKLRNIQEEILKRLKLPYRVLDMPTEELGHAARRKFDVEALFVNSNKPEATAANAKPSTRYVHTLNATAIAVPRVLLAILERYRENNGDVIIPDVLRPYMGGLERISHSNKRANTSGSNEESAI